MRYLPEPKFDHGGPSKIGVLLVNLGTPAAPTRAAVRTYLKEFLWDPRVVEIPRPLWWLILNGVILNTRPGASAKKYASIWTSEGSPLLVNTARQATMLRGFLGESVQQPIAVEFGMRYGQPSISAALDRLREANCDRILLLPLYPQYAASTTASAMDRFFALLARMRNTPEVRVVKHFHDHPGYIDAVVRGIHRYWQQHGKPDALVLSFHGLPRFSLDRGDPYHCECHKTARLVTEALQFDAAKISIAFQSRFGRAEWLKPYTTEVLSEYARSGAGRVDIVCPGFVADCLETLEEIAVEAKAHFVAAGGKELNQIPCLNADDAWLHGLTRIVLDHLGGWLGGSREAAERDAADRARRARAAGASR